MREEDISVLVEHRMEQALTALGDAEFLLQGGRSPQSIINRAYYAMFYAALALLQKIGAVPSKHTGVISLFDSEFVRNGILAKELSRDFHKAFELRQTSDYRTFKPVSREKAEEMLGKAKSFVATVKAHLGHREGGV